MAPIQASSAPLLAVLGHPEQAGQLPLRQWEGVLQRARSAGVASALSFRVLGACPLEDLDHRVVAHLQSARRAGLARAQMARWECSELGEVAAEAGFPVLLLKGAAYLLGGHPFAVARFVSDVDLLVPKRHLRAMEDRLLTQGYEAVEMDAYDERYYRDWSHETPPLRHPGRPLEVDLHHTITPVTGSLRPDAELLFAASQPLPGSPFRTLCPEDQVLHACLHCFHDGDLNLRLREVVDIDALLRAYSEREDFAERLLQRAQVLGLQGPLWYGAHFARCWLDCPPAAAILADLPGPTWWRRRCMDALVPRAMLPPEPEQGDGGLGGRLARTVLLIRYHLLRMPLRLLLPHLVRKAWRRLLQRLAKKAPVAEE